MSRPGLDAVPGVGTPAREAIPLLLDAYGDRLFQLGLRNCGTRAEAQDLVQETMIQALGSWDSFQGRSRASTWLFRIALRTCRRMHRRRSGEPEHFEPLDHVTLGSEMPGFRDDGRAEADPGRGLVQGDLAKRLDGALARIPEDFRIPLVLKDIADFSLAEVAAILDVPTATVKTRIHRGRVRLRDALEAEGALPTLPASGSTPRQVCMDLLAAKLEAMDRGVDFPFPHGEVCDRCAALFRSMDLATDVCTSLRQGVLPAPFRSALKERLRGSPAP